MADKTVKIHLLMLVDQAIRDQQRLAAATRGTAQELENVGRRGAGLEQVGGSLTRNVTVPLAAAGVGAIKLGNDFDQTFGRMVGLAGVAKDEVAGLKDQVLELAGEVGRGPQELAEGLYFASSAGFDAAQSMKIVEQASMGAAAGLGETKQVVNAVTNVLGTYGTDAITAAEATDVLTAAARVSKIEASELGPQLGRLLPTAKLLNVSFGQVAGTMAFLSQGTGDASLSATMLDGILRKLLNPSAQGKKALDEVGLSAAELHRVIGEGGLPAVFDLLREKIGGNTDVLNRLFDDVQAFQGASLVLTDTTGNLGKALDATADSAGANKDAFEATEGPARDMARAWADIQASLIEAGAIIGPIAANFLGFGADALSVFNALPEPLQAGVLGLGAFALGVGPVLSISGKLIHLWDRGIDVAGRFATAGADVGSMFGTIETNGRGADRVVGQLNTSLTRSQRIMGLLSQLSILGIGASLTKQFTPSDIDPADLSKLENALLDLGQGGKVAGELASVGGDDLNKLADAIERVGAPSVATQVSHTVNELASLGGLFTGDENLDEARQKIDDIDKALASLAGRDPQLARASFDAIVASLGELGIPADRVKSLFDDYDSALADVDTTQQVAAGSADELGGDMQDLGGDMEEVDLAAQAVAESVQLLRDEIDKLFKGLDTQSAIDSFQSGLNDMRAGFESADQRVADLRGRLDELNADKVEKAADASERLASAQRDLAAARGEKDPEERARRVADAEARIADIRRDAASDQADLDDRILETQREIDEAIESTSRSLSGNSEAAIENRRNMEQLARQAADAIIAAREDGEHTAAELEALRDSQIADLEAVAAQLGLNADQVSTYTGLLDAIPLNIETTLELNIWSAQRALDQFLKQLEPYGGLVGLQTALAANETGTPEGRALGGPMDAGRAYVTHADELVVPREDKWVYDAAQTKGILGAPVMAMGSAGSASYDDHSDRRAMSVSIVAESERGESRAQAMGRSLKELAYLSGWSD